jgi:spermidine synthase
MVLLFAFTLFLSSSLLFVVQPMVAKMMLPLLGGTPAVWNTCMVFFQATLLAGYLYAHASTRWLRFQHQALLHIVMLVASFLVLPIVVARHNAEPPPTDMPILWLLRVLVMTVGVPFFLVSASGPLLQRWFTRTDHPLARDPYFLSVAGNIGSIAALLAYPALLEPTLRLAEQSSVWTVGYVGLVLLTGLCFFFVYRQSRVIAHSATSNDVETAAATLQPPTWRQRGHWIVLAFVPSSLLLGVTTFLTTDVAAVPLLWIVPLVVYLLSFVLVFSRRTILPHLLVSRALPLWVLPLAWLIVFNAGLPVVVLGPIHLLAFFLAAMVCHGQLARRRPEGRYLTEFYLSMSLGGVLGGLFNALVAPLVFRSVLEYPLALVLACALYPGRLNVETPHARRLDLALPAIVGAMTLAVMYFAGAADAKVSATLVLALMIPSVLCFSFSARPVRFALGVGALMLAGGGYVAAQEQITHRGRSFFGVHRVFDVPERHQRYLVHGGIVHGVQHLEPAKRREPSAYYHKAGPIGQVFAELRHPAPNRVAVIGLGIGGLAAYSERGERWTFFEIDPAIAELARDTRQFTFLADSPADLRIVLGDARIALTKEPDRAYDMLILDAFSSDAIPVHLLTREALQLYLRTLDESGLLAFHISNRYLQLAPLVAELARDAGLTCLVRYDKQMGPDAIAQGRVPSQWAVLARSPETLRPLIQDARWKSVDPGAGAVAWTDDFSNPLSVMRWFGN